MAPPAAENILDENDLHEVCIVMLCAKNLPCADFAKLLFLFAVPEV
jgi:hypothetical protein